MTNSVGKQPFFNNSYDEINKTRLYEVRPMFYNRVENIRGWTFPKEIQYKILNEVDEDWSLIDFSQLENGDECEQNPACPDSGDGNTVSTDALKYDLNHGIMMELTSHNKYIPYTFNLHNKADSKLCYELCPYFTCPCSNVKSEMCFSKNCKYKYSKNMFPNESKLKDGLEIMDIPSTLLETIEKRANDNERKRRMKSRRLNEAVASASSGSGSVSPNVQNQQQQQQQINPQMFVNQMGLDNNAPANGTQNGTAPNAPAQNGTNGMPGVAGLNMFPPMLARNIIGTLNMLNNINNGNETRPMFLRTVYGRANMNNVTFAEGSTSSDDDENNEESEDSDSGEDTNNKGVNQHPHTTQQTNTTQHRLPINFTATGPATQVNMNTAMTMDVDEHTQSEEIATANNGMSVYMNDNINTDLNEIRDIGKDDMPKRKLD